MKVSMLALPVLGMVSFAVPDAVAQTSAGSVPAPVVEPGTQQAGMSAEGQPTPAPSAQDQPTEGANQPTTRPDDSQKSVPINVSGIAPSASRDKFAYFDQFLEQGQTSTFPGSADTILQDAGGVRSWLGEHDMGVRLISAVTGATGLLPTGQPRDPQRYNGQRPTLQLAAQNIELTWRADRIGLPNTSFSVGFNNTFTSFAPNGRDSLYLRNLIVYQSLFNDKLTVKAGIITNNYEYVGFYVGGSPILASGISSLLPIQAGLGADPANPLVVNVTGYGAKGSYIRVGVQRSVSPLGLNEEVAQRRNPFDIDFRRADAGALFIGEVGIRRAATAGSKQIWLRVGGFYNDSKYRRFDNRGTAANASFYALADRQFTQSDSTRPARGVYLGASAFWIPQNVNTSHLSFEGRAYAVGPFGSRPADTLSFRATWTKFSDDAWNANIRNGLFANKDQFNVTSSYSVKAGRGIYVVPAVTYLKHPSFIGDYKDAIVSAVQVVLLL